MHGNAYVSFSPFVYKVFLKPFKSKSLFQNSFLSDKKVEKQKLSFQNRFLCMFVRVEVKESEIVLRE